MNALCAGLSGESGDFGPYDALSPGLLVIY